jgi:ubiquinone biosynthesis accessory factor UbiJ
MLRPPTALALNHILKQNEWALQRLARHFGKTVRFNIAPFSFTYTIQNNGLLAAAELDVLPERILANAPYKTSDQHPDATCTFPPSLLPRLALHDEAAMQAMVSEGDTALLADVLYMSRNLRWDVAEDLSYAVGDIAAERIVQFAHGGQQQVHDTARNLSQALAEYWTEERPLLAKPDQVARFIQNVDKLRDDVARLDQRISRLTSLTD